MNRRQVLLRGALLAALAPVVRAAGIAPGDAGGGHAATPRDPPGPTLAVHDPAYRRSREFASALHDRGARVVALQPDALAAWHGTLGAACAATPGLRIVGLTTRTDFLVLRDLARAAGLAPLAVNDADARDAAAGVPRRRATLVAWVLAPRATVA